MQCVRGRKLELGFTVALCRIIIGASSDAGQCKLSLVRNNLCNVNIILLIKLSVDETV